MRRRARREQPREGRDHDEAADRREQHAAHDDAGERLLHLLLARVAEHGLERGALPLKLWYAGPMFRYERPQAGRYRQFQQVGVEAVGSDDPALDAEVIAVADEGFRAVGLDGYRIEGWQFLPRATLRRLIGELRRRHIHPLLYFRAFVGQDTIGTDSPGAYDEALARGYVATRSTGQPYTFPSNFNALGAQISSSGAAEPTQASGSSGSSQCQHPMLYEPEAKSWGNSSRTTGT